MLQYYCTPNGSLSLKPNGTDGGIGIGDEDFAKTVGLVYIVLGFFTIPISVFVLMVISRPPLIKHSCYKMMTFITVLDIVNLFNGATVPGIFSLYNMHHCNSGAIVIYHAYFLTVIWFIYCCASCVLALNRMLEFVSRNLAIILFDGKRVFIWLGAASAYGIFFNFLVPDSFYFYNPYGGSYAIYRTSGKPNAIHIFNNMFKFGFVSVAYALMLIFMYRRMKTSTNTKISTFQIKVSIQTLAIAALADGVTCGYLAIGYAPLPPKLAQYAGIACEVLWISLHGGTGIIYMIMNNAVNARMKSIFCANYRIPASECTLTEVPRNPSHTVAATAVITSVER